MMDDVVHDPEDWETDPDITEWERELEPVAVPA